MATLRWGAVTHEGQLRTQNEDNHHVGDALFVVADGMGGHLAGEVASEMAVTRLDERLPSGQLASRDDLIAAINEANVEIYNASVHNAEQAGMGTTITAIAVVDDPLDGEVLAVANVGDSRGYVLRHGRLRQLTIDHSFVQELVAEGAITRDEARYHPRRNIVTRALGIEPFVRVDSWTMPIIRGDRFLLCSDGLVDEVHDDVIQGILVEHADDPTAAARALVDAANLSGGRDNITAVVIDVLEGDDPPDPTEEFDVLPVWSDDQLDITGENQIVADPLDEDEVAELVPAAAAAHSDDHRSAPAGRSGAAGPGAPPKRRRGSRLARVVLVLGVAAVLVLGFAILAAWARSGYFVAFDDDGTVVIYQGRHDQLLWFEPTREAKSTFTREQLDDESITLVEQAIGFETRADAERFIASSLSATHDHDDNDHHHDHHDHPAPDHHTGAGHADHGRLSMAATIPVPARLVARRRSTELTLIVMAAAITGVAYTLASLGANAVIPARLGPFLVLLLALIGIAHIAVRVLARGADATLLPLAVLLHGIGYVMISRLDDTFAAQQSLWSLVAIAAFVLTLGRGPAAVGPRPLQVDPVPDRRRAVAAADGARASARTSTVPGSGSTSGRSASNPASSPRSRSRSSSPAT